ncbi:nuclear transport factor 2 family protein [Streptomyces sp. MB09-02B]|uniref:nuclear transport factor 2 family protein n=1 Tax=Streptomyces sp. MB09-02B TaxID=3028667 RepID=UPI0029A25A12|nr:nuclear transport factor 2 family protein [Streptomyces sp. MB09-02B]MDX3641720.1 nuclear transport factor 2 family protein [Streptomyces sp. MB09-02B]
MGETIEARLQRLEDIESLRQLKAKYTWLLDHKQWDEWADCFSPDFTFETGGNQLPLDTFVSVVSNNLQPLVTSHQLHQFKVEITSATTATGVWWLRDHLVHPGNGSEFRGRAYYHEKYLKEAGEWKISASVLEYVNSEGRVLTPGPDHGMAIGLTM